MLLLIALSALSVASLGVRADCPFVNRPVSTPELVYYDSYNGTMLTDVELSVFEEAGVSFYCVNKIAECNSTEGRRIDGSCNNLLNPVAGAGHAPFKRILTSVYSGDSSGYAVRLAENGSSLPSPRKLRTKMMAMGEVAGSFTQLMLHFFIFAASDVAAMSIHDTLNYVDRTVPCCSVEGAADPVCAPIDVPADDPVHRFSGVRCQNITWPISFQSSGCISNSSKPERVNFGTPFFDLSVMYGNDNATSDQQRIYSGGLLGYELHNGRHWPVVNTSRPNNATLDGLAGLTGVNFVYALFQYREHNRLAAELAKVNPCWDDEQLFTTAREINIAAYQQMFYYELLGPLMGTDNLIASGVLSDNDGFRDVYDETVRPDLTLESLLALRWVHTFQQGILNLYNADGELVDNYELVKLMKNKDTLKNNNATDIKYFAQGAFRGAGGAISDGIYDPILADIGLGPVQYALDVAAADVAKNRLFGLAPYIDYLEYCTGDAITSFDDLVDAGLFTAERVEMMKELYTSPGDIDLIVAMWNEALVDGGSVPKTFYCLVTEQLVRSVVSDRHWFERASRPNAFTEAQMTQIRKASVARIMCDNGDTVTEIQPRAFEVISDDNPLTDCTLIPSIDLSAWADTTSSE